MRYRYNHGTRNIRCCRSAGKAKGSKGYQAADRAQFSCRGAPLGRSFSGCFSFISGLTGAVISWDHELDEWLNPQLFKAQSEGDPVSSLALAEQLEAADPRLLVTWVPLAVEQGHNLGLGVGPRLDPATGKAFDLDFNQVALDPVNGEMRGKRMWGEISLSRENLLPFLYKLHYSMHLPDGFGIEFGVWFMGDSGHCMGALTALSPYRFRFQARAPGPNRSVFAGGKERAKLNFDLHRSGGVWVWGILLILAVTAISMNLKQEIMRPLVSVFSPLTPSPFTRTPNPPELPIEPIVSRQAILELAASEAKALGWSTPPGGIFYSPEFGIYGVTFFEPGHEHGDGGWAIHRCFSKGRMAHLPAQTYRVREARGTFSCRHSFRCIQAEFLGFQAAS